MLFLVRREVKKWLFKLFVFAIVYMIIYNFIMINELVDRTYELKNCFEEVKAKHNTLRIIVQKIYENK